MTYKIDSIKKLDLCLSYGFNDFFILLSGGVRSSKTIVPTFKEEKPYFVIHNIDGTEEELTQEELWTKTNIGEAIDKGSLYAEYVE